MHLLKEALEILIETGTLPSQYKPHILSGNHNGEWEAHIKGDWLIIREKHDDQLTLVMLATGTHSDHSNPFSLRPTHYKNRIISVITLTKSNPHGCCTLFSELCTLSPHPYNHVDKK